MSILDEIREGVIAGDVRKVKEQTELAVAGGLPVAGVLRDGLIAGMNVVGARFKVNEVYVPEVLMSARAMHTGLALIKPLIVSAGIREKGVVLIGTVQGDMHDIGKNLVVMMLEGAGYRVIDLGVDVPVEKFIRGVEEHRPPGRSVRAAHDHHAEDAGNGGPAPGLPGRAQNHRRWGAGYGKVCPADRRGRLCSRRGKRRGCGCSARRLNPAAA